MSGLHCLEFCSSALGDDRSQNIWFAVYVCFRLTTIPHKQHDRKKWSDSRWHRELTRDLLISSVFIHHLIGKGVKSDSENTLELWPVLLSTLTEVHSKQRLHHSSFY